MTRFVPARFALYEFDERDQQAGPVRRWLNHWDGALGRPAAEVTLAYSVDDAVVLVCTSGGDYDDVEARSRAAHLALGGNLGERLTESGEAHHQREAGVSIDVHQHLWPPALVEALRRRQSPPRLVGWRLDELSGEPAYDVGPADHDIDSRRALAHQDGLDLVLLSLSSPLGIEQLPPAQALPLLAAWHDGVADSRRRSGRGPPRRSPSRTRPP